MTYQEIVEAVHQLSSQERLALLELLARSVRLDLADTRQDAPLSQLLHGILSQGGVPPTDEELRDDYTNYLIRKYA
ncbi:MAG: hypothetical protein U0361_24985 [Nitrospiraceae bacterium]